MKKFLLILAILLLCAFLVFRVIRAKVGHDLSQPVIAPDVSPTPTVIIDQLHNTNTSLFVPDWTLETIPDTYDQYIYFGVSPTTDGIDSNSSGVTNISQFLNAMPQEKKMLLAIEMINSDTNSTILKSKSLQQKVISQSISLAKANGFSGIVLDLEMSGIPLDPLVTEITDFTKSFDMQAKSQELQFDITLYGDTFYRVRPFDVKTISANVDMVYIMAYDFHKAGSNPGPNFPLNGKDTYGYDMGQMADDFLQVVPNQKLGVIFGMFGYDWPVDNQGNAVGQGQPVTDSQIQNKFLNNCSFKDCQIKRDPISEETEVQYTDDANQKHIVWFEDMQSVTAKEQLLRKRGIGTFSFWANSYF